MNPTNSNNKAPPNIPLVELVNEPLVKGDTWYLLERSWYDMCQSFHESADPTFHPGPIDNSALFQPVGGSGSQPLANGAQAESKFKAPTSAAVSMGNRPLRSDLSEAEKHFILVPEKCWNLLKEAYGITSPNHTIKRKVIEQSPGMAVVEIHPINLKLCLYGGKEATVEKHFSRLTTMDELQQEMRHLFNIPSDSETKLWINSTIFTFKPSAVNSTGRDSISSSTGELSPSKSENNLNNNQQQQQQVASTNTTTTTTVTTAGASTPIKSSPSLPPPSTPTIGAPLSVSVASSPNVVTRQAAKSANKPIPLPDVSTSSTNTPSTTRSSNLSTSTSDSPLSIMNSTSSNTKENSPTTTLADACVSDQAIVTLEVINSDGTWPSSRPRFGSVSTRSSKAQPGLCGLSNMGNTCFMNAALQCLSNTPPLTNYILTDKFIYDINPDNPLGMHGEIARTYAELIKVMWSGNNSSFLPREFKCAVSRFAPQFNGFAQQDSQELMAFLLDGLHEDLNRIRNKPYIEIKSEIERRPDEVVAAESWANYKKRNDSIVVDTFHAMLKSTLVCPGCKLVSVTFDPFCYLSLPLPVKREKQINVVFLPAPRSVSEELLKEMSVRLLPEEVATIRKYGASISSFNADIDGCACFIDPKNRPRLCKLQVPQSGQASEICDIVARVMNEERPDHLEQIRPDNLLVVELAGDGKICKVYESSEHYHQINDIVVVEKKSKYAIPLYLRERKSRNTNTGSVISRPLFVHVDDLKFETLYKSIIASLSNVTSELQETLAAQKLNGELHGPYYWYKIRSPTDVVDEVSGADGDDDDDEDEQMDCQEESSAAKIAAETQQRGDDDQKDTTRGTGGTDSDAAKVNGSNTGGETGAAARSPNAFELSVVNSFGNHVVETLDQRSKPREYTTKLYLSATFTLPPGSSFTRQFAHLRQVKNSDSVALFVPKVTVKPTLQLNDCISQFTGIERLGADDPWYCPKCKKHQQATKKFDIWSLPKVLIIHLKRFSFSRSWRDKIDTLVEFPVEGLDMSKYVLNPKQRQQSQVYNLIGVSNHFGGLGGGHYTAYAKNSVQNAWYSFDDSLVTQTSANNVVTRSAYVLFYQLQEDPVAAD